MPQVPVGFVPDGFVPDAPPPSVMPRDARGMPAVSSDASDAPDSPLLAMLGPFAHPQTITDFARLLTLPVDTVKKAVAGALTMAAARPAAGATLSATGRGLERAGTAVEGPAKMATAYELVTDPKRAVLTMAAPAVLKASGRGLQRVGAAVTGDVGPVLSEAAPAIAEAPPVAPAPAPVAPPVDEFTAARAARQAPVAGAPSQKALNEAALAARREAYQASLRGETAPAPAAAPVEVPPAGPVVKESGKMQLTAPEMKEFTRMLAKKIPAADALTAVKQMRALAARLGGATDGEVAKAVAHRGVTGQW